MRKRGQYSLLEICLFVAIAIAIVLRIISLSSREFWYDEVLSLLLSTGQKKLYNHPSDVPLILASYKPLLAIPLENSWSDFLQNLEKLLKGLVAEPHPPLFFIEQHFGLRLWGNSEAGMRTIPVLYSIGAIFCSYNLGRQLLGYRGGLLLAAVLGLNPFFLFHSLNVRMYCGLVFWSLLSGWATIELLSATNLIENLQQDKPKNTLQKAIWSIILICSVTAGMMTFYYFCFWLFGLGILVLSLDFVREKQQQKTLNLTIVNTLVKWQTWHKYSLLVITGLIITIPWLLWGTRQQFNNADLGRFKAGSNIIETTGKHLAGILTTLGINLITGDWASVLSPTVVNLTGLVAIALIVASFVYLWRKGYYRLLLIITCLSLTPLGLMVAVDVVSGKFTVGFGFGRSLIFILPGCLLLLVAAISKMPAKWQTYTAITLLIIYFSTTVADFSLRQRSMFRDLAAIIERQPDTPTLVMMNSTAWGHVLRLAYYLPERSPIELLAQPAKKLNTALVKTLQTHPNKYRRLIWLESDRPVWSPTSTEAEIKAVQKTLSQQYRLERETYLKGTWELDNFKVRVYHE